MNGRNESLRTASVWCADVFSGGLKSAAVSECAVTEVAYAADQKFIEFARGFSLN